VLGDKKLAAQLVDEDYRQQQLINDEVRMNIEIEYQMAAADAG